MRHTLIRTLAITAAAAVAIGACSDDGDGFEPGASIPTEDTNAPTNSAESDDTTSDTEPRDSTQPEDTTSDTELPDTIQPEDTTPDTEPAPSTTEEAPATTVEPEVGDTPQTPGFDFPPADLDTDPGSPNNNREVTPEEQPIVDAYLAVFEADLTVGSTWPLDPQADVLLEAPMTERVLNGYAEGLGERTANNQVLDVSGGLTSRPYVIEDNDGDPNRVVVWDCFIDAVFWKDVDTGEKVPPEPSYPNVGPPGVEFGWSAALVLVDGEWLVDDGGPEPRACE